MKKLYFLVPFCLFTIFIEGCGHDQSGGAQAVSQTANGQAPQQITRSTENFLVDGAMYSSPCLSSKFEFGGIKFPNTDIKFTSTDLGFTQTQEYFTDDCKTASLVITETGTVEKLGSSETVPTAIDENLNFANTAVVLTNAFLVTAFNRGKVCGFSDWELDTEREIVSENDSFSCPGTSSPRSEATLILVENSRLFFGKSVITKQALDETAIRPTKVDRSLFLDKQ